MEKKDINFDIVKSLIKNRFIVREWLINQKGYYLDEDKHESMTNKFLDGVF